MSGIGSSRRGRVGLLFIYINLALSFPEDASPRGLIGAVFIGNRGQIEVRGQGWRGQAHLGGVAGAALLT